MRRLAPSLAVPLLALSLAACEPRIAPGPASDGPAEPLAKSPDAAGGPVLGHLEMRGARVTILGGPEGPRYTVATDADGVVAERLSEAELAARFPELHERLERGVARGNHAIALPED